MSSLEGLLRLSTAPSLEELRLERESCSSSWWKVELDVTWILACLFSTLQCFFFFLSLAVTGQVVLLPGRMKCCRGCWWAWPGNTEPLPLEGKFFCFRYRDSVRKSRHLKCHS